MNIKKFSDLSVGRQFLTILAFMGVSGSGIMTAFLWAADHKINEKYATDADLRMVQQHMHQEMKSIKRVLEANTLSVTSLSSSVESLGLTVTDLQVSKVEADIAQLAAKVGLSSHERKYLKSLQNRLNNLRVQRDALFRRSIRTADRSP